MKAMLPSTSWISRLLAFAVAAAPALANAQSLPKGYASDELPAAAAKPAAATSAAAPVMKPTSSDDDGATATVQISTSTDEYADTDPSALTDFQEPLQSYGVWVTDDTYGTVWVPDTSIVGSDFAPYQSNGYWSTTDDGEWLWVSTYDWGYVPFHYGRWTYISSRGWSWIPGRTYAASWVVWRTSDYGYIGWAPMPPTYYWSGGSVAYFTTVPSAAYVFCPTTHVYNTNVHSYVVHDKSTIKTIAANSRNYTPASPTAAGSPAKKAPDSAKAGSGSGSGGARAAASKSALYKPKGPSAREAGIPDSALPKTRAAADTRAQMFSKKSTTAKAKALVKAQRTASLGSAGKAPASRAGAVGRGSASISAVTAGRGALPGATAGRGGLSGATTGRRSGPPSARGSAVSSSQGSSVQPSQPQSHGHAPVIRTPSSRVPGAPPASQPSGRSSHTSSNAVHPQVSQHAPAARSAPAAVTKSAPASRPAARASAPASAPRASAPRASSPSPSPRASGGGSHRR